MLRDLSFSIEGGITGIAGPNGSGKSTLMRCLAGLSRPGSGSVEWTLNGTAISPSDLTKHLGYAAPYVQLYEELTVRENLLFLRNIRTGQICETEQMLSENFELAGFIDTSFGDLSSGQQQRVKLAAAAIHQPNILCLDEPGTNLDEYGHALVKKLAARCTQNNGMVLLASNQHRELDLCDQIIDVDKS